MAAPIEHAGPAIVAGFLLGWIQVRAGAGRDAIEWRLSQTRYGFATSALTSRYSSIAAGASFWSGKLTAAMAMAIPGCRVAVESANTVRCGVSGPPSR